MHPFIQSNMDSSLGVTATRRQALYIAALVKISRSGISRGLLRRGSNFLLNQVPSVLRPDVFRRNLADKLGEIDQLMGYLDVEAAMSNTVSMVDLSSFSRSFGTTLILQHPTHQIVPASRIWPSRILPVHKTKRKYARELKVCAVERPNRITLCDRHGYFHARVKLRRRGEI